MLATTYKECFINANWQPIIDEINTKRMPYGYIGIHQILADPNYDEGVLLVMKNNSIFNISKRELKELTVTLIIDKPVKEGAFVVTESLNDKSAKFRQGTGISFTKFGGQTKGVFCKYEFRGAWIIKNILYSVSNSRLGRTLTKDLIEETSFKFQTANFDSKAYIESLNQKEEDYSEMLDNIFKKVRRLAFVEHIELKDKLYIYLSPGRCYGGIINGKQYSFALPPMIIVLDYYSGKYSFSAGGGVHPHISDGRICLGGYADVMLNKWKDVELCIIMLYELLSGYNGSSPYFRPSGQSEINCRIVTNKYNTAVGTKHEFVKMFFADDKPISLTELKSADPNNFLRFF